VKRRVILPGPITEKIATFGLSRSTLVGLYNACHEGIPDSYDQRRAHRVVEEERHYWHFVALHDGGKKHLLALEVDDTTSPDNLIIVAIKHFAK